MNMNQTLFRPKWPALIVALAMVLLGIMGPTQIHAGGIVGDGTSASCTDAALATAMTGGGTVTFKCGPNPHTIIVNTFVIDKDTTVDGGGLITLDGEKLRQIFYVQSGASLTLMGLTLANADSGAGGAIYNEGSVTLTDSTIRNSNATGSGGAIYNVGTLSVSDSSFVSNSATDSGGAIYNNGGTATVTDTAITGNTASEGAGIAHNGGTFSLQSSLLTGNVADDNGGGIQDASGQMSVTNVTLADNIADRGGGMDLSSGATATLTNTTLYINRADLGGGLFSNLGSTVKLKNTIVAASLARNGLSPSLNCDNGGSPVQSLGHNLADDNSCNLNATGDRPGITDAKLGPLADNGGPTLTHMPLADSEAIDNGSGCPPTDQRGVARPIGPACDIGAVEYGTPTTRVFLPMIIR
jgi:predicted outer membrane repeat protein